MMDLEKVLPTGVQVTSIEPVITKEGDVNIRLRVSGDRDRAVQLVRNLETSQRFLSPRLAGVAQTQEANRRAVRRWWRRARWSLRSSAAITRCRRSGEDE